MKLILRIVALLAVLAGVIWMLQGFNVIPQGLPLSHSFMVGKRIWALYGGILAALGVIVYMWASQRRAPNV
jgi:hypothetical protein